jgi:hypothetical protein
MPKNGNARLDPKLTGNVGLYYCCYSNDSSAHEHCGSAEEGSTAVRRTDPHRDALQSALRVGRQKAGAPQWPLQAARRPQHQCDNG